MVTDLTVDKVTAATVSAATIGHLGTNFRSTSFVIATSPCEAPASGSCEPSGVDLGKSKAIRAVKRKIMV